MEERDIPILNAANALTLFRVALVPLFVVLLLGYTLLSASAALAVYFVASVTDYLDGVIARRFGLRTSFGVFLDPLADKLLVGGAFISLATIPDLGIPLWIVAVMLLREVAVTVLRVKALRRNMPIQTERSGKVKTFFQMGSILIILIMVVLQRALYNGESRGETGFWVMRLGNPWGTVLQLLPAVLVGISTILAILSMIQYLVKNRHLLTPGGGIDFTVRAVTSCLFIGSMGRGSGTVASLAACGIWVFTSSSRYFPFLVLASVAAGMLMSGYAERKVFKEPDSPKIVIDELAGMLVTYLSFTFSWSIAGLVYGTAGFLLFRLFDILKPGPLHALQRIKGGPGIMLDDLAAAVAANGLLQLIRLILFR
jgi:CDP-diacylglycerol--glycerol-3-phosphate 3-phosphatidyltransferase